MQSLENNNRKHILDAPVTSIHDFGNGWFSLECEAPGIAAAAVPGQFVQVRGWDGSVPLLGRPIAIAGSGPDGAIMLLIRVAGAGTALLAKKKTGEFLHITGPLGNGFPETQPGGEVCLVAGGTGLAPLLFLMQRRRSQNHILFFGARTLEDCLHLDALFFAYEIDAQPVVITTEDGSRGIKGLVTGALVAYLDQSARAPAALFACGPTPMMRRVHELARDAGAPCWVSLEAHMGCGFGACMGCAVPGVEKPYYHVCEHGPVFSSDKIKW